MQFATAVRYAQYGWVGRTLPRVPWVAAWVPWIPLPFAAFQLCVGPLLAPTLPVVYTYWHLGFHRHVHEGRTT